MDDLIRRSDAIEAITYSYLNVMTQKERALLIQAIPSAVRPSGEWIETDRLNCGARVYQCSVCGEDVDEMPTVMGVPKYRFCPYCGAMLKGTEDE